MKKLIVILMILIVGILACGCTSQPATPAATTVQTTVPPTPVPTTVPTTVVTTEVPTVVNTTVVPTTNVTTATPTPTPLPDVKIEILNSWAFKPSTISVPAGTKVIWMKKSADDYIYQIIIKGSVGSVATSPVISSNYPSWSYTFAKAGTYTITEVNHPSFQIGKIIVT